MLGRLPLDHAQSVFRHLADYDGNAGLDDAGLLVSNLLQRVAQDIGVVEADAHDQAAARSDDVRGVQSPSQAYLEGYPFTLDPLVEHEGKRSLEFELANAAELGLRELLCERPEHRGESRQDVLGDQLATKLHPLARVIDVGAKEGSGPVPTLVQDALHVSGRTPLPVGPGDVDELGVWPQSIIQTRPMRELAHAVQPQPPTTRGEAGDVIEGFLVGQSPPPRFPGSSFHE